MAHIFSKGSMCLINRCDECVPTDAGWKCSCLHGDPAKTIFEYPNEQSFTWDGSIEEWKESWSNANPSYIKQPKE